MSMQHHNLTQGSHEWHAHRAKYWNASDAPAMMGCSPYKTRQQFLHECWERAQGIEPPEPSPALAAIFADGHRFEALARALTEGIIGEVLYPVVGTRGRLGASFDGLTMAENFGCEHKTLNKEIRACFDASGACLVQQLPLHLRVQMQQQCMVAECDKILFASSKWGDGDALIEAVHAWYASSSKLVTEIERGWDQFEADLATYVPPELTAFAPIGRTPETLPALRIEVTGIVTTSNLDVFKTHAMAVFGGIKTELVTDQDFADADKTVKWCAEVKKKLVIAKESALSQTESIDALFRVIDEITAESDRVRLTLERIIKTEREASRIAVVHDSQAALYAHIDALNERLCANWVPRKLGNFGEAIKGLKTLASCKDRAATALANAKIAASAMADRFAANFATLTKDGTDWLFLFADFANVGDKPAEDFAAIAAQRIEAHKHRIAAEAAIAAQALESQRLRNEQAAAERAAIAEAQALAQAAPVVAMPPPVARPAPSEIDRLRAILAPEIAEFELCDAAGIYVAGCDGPREAALRELRRCAIQYAEHGPLFAVEVLRVRFELLGVVRVEGEA